MAHSDALHIQIWVTIVTRFNKKPIWLNWMASIGAFMRHSSDPCELRGEIKRSPFEAVRTSNDRVEIIKYLPSHALFDRRLIANGKSKVNIRHSYPLLSLRGYLDTVVKGANHRSAGSSESFACDVNLTNWIDVNGKAPICPTFHLVSKRSLIIITFVCKFFLATVLCGTHLVFAVVGAVSASTVPHGSFCPSPFTRCKRLSVPMWEEWWACTARRNAVGIATVWPFVKYQKTLRMKFNIMSTHGTDWLDCFHTYTHIGFSQCAAFIGMVA